DAAGRRPGSRRLCGPGRPRPGRRACRGPALPSRVARARRAPGAADRTSRRRAPSRELEFLVADLDGDTVLGARGAQRARELLRGRGRAEHAEAALGAQQTPAARLRLRSVHEEVGEIVRAALLRLGLRHEREETAAEVLDARARRARDAEHGDDPRIVDREVGLRLEVDLVQDDDLRALVEAGAVRAELGVDRPPLLVDLLRRGDYVDERPR